MRFNIIHLGKINIQRGIVSKYRALIRKSRIAYREADQISIQDEDEDEMVRRLADVQVVCPIYDGSILAYRNVGWHLDDWDRCANSKGKFVAPGFLHVMLSGECEITVGRKTITARRGDVFLLNPNVIHMVRTKRLCMTYTAVVPAHDIFNALIQMVNTFGKTDGLVNVDSNGCIGKARLAIAKATGGEG